MTNDYLKGWADGYLTARRELLPHDDGDTTEELPAFDLEPPTVPDRPGIVSLRRE